MRRSSGLKEGAMADASSIQDGLSCLELMRDDCESMATG